MCRFNRLLAYVAEFDVNETDTIISTTISFGALGSFHLRAGMKCIEELVKKLNSGEVVL